MDRCGSPLAMDSIVCPKPRRAGPSNCNNSSMPLRFHMRNDVEAFDSKSGFELLDLILRKQDFEAERSSAVASSPPFLFGSPPCRAPNPLVQDADFGVQKPTCLCSSPSDSDSSLSNLGRGKFGKKPAAIRVEGFECQNARYAAMA